MPCTTPTPAESGTDAHARRKWHRPAEYRVELFFGDEAWRAGARPHDLRKVRRGVCGLAWCTPRPMAPRPMAHRRQRPKVRQAHQGAGRGDEVAHGHPELWPRRDRRFGQPHLRHRGSPPAALRRGTALPSVAGANVHAAVRSCEGARPLHLLEIFSGSGQLARAFRRQRRPVATAVDRADRPDGDVTQPNVERRILGGLRGGAYDAAWLAPPCTTWSQTRRPALREADGMPTAEGHVGRGALNVHEGDRRLRFAARLASACAGLGVPCVIEPAHLHRVAARDHRRAGARPAHSCGGRRSVPVWVQVQKTLPADARGVRAAKCSRAPLQRRPRVVQCTWAKARAVDWRLGNARSGGLPAAFRKGRRPGHAAGDRADALGTRLLEKCVSLNRPPGFHSGEYGWRQIWRTAPARIHWRSSARACRLTQSLAEVRVRRI